MLLSLGGAIAGETVERATTAIIEYMYGVEACGEGIVGNELHQRDNTLQNKTLTDTFCPYMQFTSIPERICHVLTSDGYLLIGFETGIFRAAMTHDDQMVIAFFQG